MTNYLVASLMPPTLFRTTAQNELHETPKRLGGAPAIFIAIPSKRVGSMCVVLCVGCEWVDVVVCVFGRMVDCC